MHRFPKLKNPMLMKMFLSYAITFAAVDLGGQICHSIDGMMISNLLGDGAMAAHGLAGSYFTILSIVSAIIVTGVQAMLTRAAGMGDNDAVNDAFSFALETAILLSLVITAALYLFNGPITTLLGADERDPAFRQMVLQYNMGFFAIVPALILHRILCTMVALDGKKQFVLYATIVLSVTDVGLNYLFIRVFRWGMFGVGLSSSVSQILAVLTTTSVLFRKDSMFHFRLTLPTRRMMQEMLLTGLPKLTRKLSATAKSVLLNRLILLAGGVTLMSAISARGIVEGLSMTIGMGISDALLMMTQVFYSEEDENAIKTTAFTAVLVLLVGGGMISVFLFVAAPLLMPLFGLEAAVTATAVTAVRYYAVSMVFVCLNEMIFNYLQAVRRQKWSHIYIVFARLTILPVAYLLIRVQGVQGLFLSYIAGEIPVTLGYFAVSALLNRRSSTNLLNAVLCIPKRFSESGSRCLDLKLTQIDDVAGISERVEQFCLSHGVDAHRAMHTALCAEEMAAIIVTDGFAADRSARRCSVRIIAEPDAPVLRFRDDCRNFSLKERYYAIQGGDPNDNLGVKIVCGLAKEVQFSHVLSMNSMIISL